jgi:hypothetical protein
MADGDPLVWHGCGDGQCLECARTDDEVLVRDSAQPDGPYLVFGRQEWARFVEAVKSGVLQPEISPASDLD